MNSTICANIILLDLIIILLIFDEEFKTGQNILLSTVFSYTLILSFPLGRQIKFHTHAKV